MKSEGHEMTEECGVKKLCYFIRRTKLNKARLARIEIKEFKLHTQAIK
jgi:hypothetical protein